MSASVSPVAQAELIAAAVQLERRAPGLGTALNEAVQDAVRAIGENPGMYSPTEDAPPGYECREFFIERFQYRVVYLVTGDDALVVAVVHAARRPGAWHRNLPTDPPPETN